MYIKARALSTIEIVLAIALFTTFVLGLSSGISYGYGTITTAGDRTRAGLLAEEGMEAVRAIRDEEYANLTNGTYGLDRTGTNWTLTGSTDTTDSKYQRTITISDGSESDSKEISINVNWSSPPFSSGSVTLHSIVADIERIISVGASWLNPSIETTYDNSSVQDGLSIVKQGNYIYMILDGSNPDLVVLDVSNTSSISVAGSLNLSGTPTDIAVSGNYAYITNNSNTQEFQVVNISNPASPSQIANINLTGNNDASAVVVNGNYAYITRDQGTNEEFYVINITNPLTPVQVAQVNLNGTPTDIAIYSNHAVVTNTDDSREVEIINITNPLLPSITTSINLNGTSDATSLNFLNQYLFTGQTDGRLTSIDMTSPASPTILSSSFNIGSSINSVSVDTTNQRLFLGTSHATQEFLIVDATNESSLSSYSSLDMTAAINGIYYDSAVDRAFIASTDDAAEFMILKPN